MADPNPLIRHPFFSTLSADEIDIVTCGLERVMIAPETIFVREGELGDCAYILVAGTVEVVKALGTADERSFGLRGPGDTIGEMSLLDPEEPRSASVCAHSTVEALVITRRDFDTMLAQYPRLSLQLLRTMSRRLRTSENATIRDLQEKNRQLNEAYVELKAAQQRIVEQEVMARELAHAQRIQLQMLPSELPHRAGIDVGAAIHAARSVGGDLYDVLELGAERLAFAIGDVAGKGMPAALYMALVSSLLRAEAGQGADAETVVRRVNRHLYARDMDSMFVTLLYCDLDLRTRRLQVIRAGHEPPLLWVGQRAVPLGTGGRALALGLADDPPLDVQVISLPPNATFLMYTDGVTDAIDEGAHPFGRARLVETVGHHLKLPAQALCDAIVGRVLAYHGIMPQFDDVAVLALHVES